MKGLTMKHEPSAYQKQRGPLRRGALWLWLSGALLALGGACGGGLANDAVIMGGESHFLRSCSATCGEGLECISDLCTKACESEPTTACDTVEGAVCTAGGLPDGAAPVCDLPCTERSRCARLGGDFECVDGFCRERAPSLDAGTGELALECSGYLDQPGETELTIRIRNERGTPIFLLAHAGCGVDSAMWLAFERDGEPVRSFRPPCSQSCERIQQTGETGFPPCDLCSQPILRLLPSAEVEAGQAWREALSHGLDEGTPPMPTACYSPVPASVGSEARCSTEMAMPPAEYRIEARAYDAVECLGTYCNEPSVCDPNTDLACDANSDVHSVVGEERRTSETTRLPGGQLVLTFR
jgi:hypothetical protein